MLKTTALVACFSAALSLAASAQALRTQLWRGLWISLPEGVEVQTQIPGPISEIRKSAYLDGVNVEMWRQKRGLAFGPEVERKIRRQEGEKNVTVRQQRGDSYWVSATHQGRWEFTRKIRLTPTSMIKAQFSVPVAQRHAQETLDKREMIMSISVRRK